MPGNHDGNSTARGMSVKMSEGHRFRCQNRDCGCEIVVSKTSVEGDFLPKCCCGTAMKKPYNPPAIRTLDGNEQRLDAIKDLVKR
jgi:hypothetical protein